MMRKMTGLVLQKGARALLHDRIVVILAIVDLNLARVRDIATEKIEEVKIQQLAPPPEASESSSEALSDSEEARQVADDREEIIKPVLTGADRTKQKVIDRAAELGYHPATIFRWIKRSEETGDLRRKERNDKGESRFGSKVEQLIKEAFNELTALDRTAEKRHEKVSAKINAANAKAKEDFENQQKQGSSSPPKELEVPSSRTVEERFRAFSDRKKCELFQGSDAARQRFDPALGKLPLADFPFEIWQIDHVLLDVLVVDDIERKPIGRPWLTIALCPCCRMAMGIDLSLDPPGEMSTGLCLAHAILPKHKWLAELGSTGEWPCWGIPGAIHGDNAFRLNFLKKYCAGKEDENDENPHRLNIIWRPAKNPRFGGHIERLARTLGEAVHFLPGTTLSSPKALGDYDPEKTACFTEGELKQWFVEKVLAYHAEKHSALGMSPMAYYQKFVLKGSATCPPIGLQTPIVDPAEQRRLQLELMPYEERTVQRYGVEIDKIFYWHDCLRRWINARDPENPKRKRKFIFRRFKRSLKSIWFYDPDLDEHYEIPTRDPSFPDISIWDLQRIRTHAKSEAIPDEQVDEAYIKARYARMREIEEQAGKKTKAALATDQRRRGWAAAPRPGPPKKPPAPPETLEEEAYERVTGFTDDD